MLCVRITVYPPCIYGLPTSVHPWPLLGEDFWDNQTFGLNLAAPAGQVFLAGPLLCFSDQPRLNWRTMDIFSLLRCICSLYLQTLFPVQCLHAGPVVENQHRNLFSIMALFFKPTEGISWVYFPVVSVNSPHGEHRPLPVCRSSIDFAKWLDWNLMGLFNQICSALMSITIMMASMNSAAVCHYLLAYDLSPGKGIQEILCLEKMWIKTISLKTVKGFGWGNQSCESAFLLKFMVCLLFSLLPHHRSGQGQITSSDSTVLFAAHPQGSALCFSN